MSGIFVQRVLKNKLKGNRKSHKAIDVGNLSNEIYDGVSINKYYPLGAWAGWWPRIFNPDEEKKLISFKRKEINWS